MNARIRVFVVAMLFSTIVPALGSAEAIKIIVIGDSTLSGGGRAYISGLTTGVPPSESFSPKLERALHARGWDISVLSGSCQG